MFKLNARFANPAPIDADRGKGLLVLDIVGLVATPVTGISLSGGSVEALTVAIVDGSGNQIISFGGGTQYTDAGVAVAHPIGTGIVFNNAGTYNFVSATQPLPITGSITATNPSIGTSGSAIPTSATLLGGSDGTNLQPLQVDASKNLKVLVQNTSLAVTGTFYQATQPISGTVTANIGTSGSLALDATVSGLEVAQASTTSGQKGTLIQGAVTTAAPAYTTAQTSPLSLTTGGLLRVDASGVTVPVSGAFYQATQPVSIATAVTVAQATGANLHTVVDSGAITANIGATNGVALDATLTGGNAVFLIKTLAKGTTAAGNPTSAPTDANTQSLHVNVTNTVPVTGTFWQVTQPVSGTVTANAGTNLNTSALALETGGNLATIVINTNKIPSLGQALAVASVPVVLTAAQITTLTPLTSVAVTGTFWQATQPVSLASLPALATGTNAIGSVNLSPTAVGGYTPYFANAITTTVTVSAAAGKFGGYMLINLNASPAYLQVFDTIGAVTLGTTVPTFVLCLPANATAANGVAANLELANGIKITNGIKVAATTTATGATTVTTGLSGLIMYL